jgi:hypothetical protein
MHAINSWLTGPGAFEFAFLAMLNNRYERSNDMPSNVTTEATFGTLYEQLNKTLFVNNEL